MTPAEWTTAFSNGGLPKWSTVETEVKSILELVAWDDPIPTRDLMEALWPKQFAIGDGIGYRTKLIKLICEKSIRLTGWFTRESVRIRYGRQTRPYLWHSPRPANVCPHCGGTLNALVTS